MATVIDKAVQWAVNIANDDSYAYVWGGWGKSDGGYDCGHLIIEAYEQAGVKVKTAGATYTGDMQRIFLKCGFKDVTLQVNRSTGAGMKKGDVLLNVLHHAAMVQEDGGILVEARGKDYGIVANAPYRVYGTGGWDCVLRYAGGAEATLQYTNFPKYNLSETSIKDIATCITGETGGIDIVACRQEASQMANLNEVYYNRNATEDNLVKALHGGWYSKDSWTRGCTQAAIEAVKFVIIDGKRTLPRYVTEHDTFPNDITNAKSRTDYSVGDEVNNCYGSSYNFYCFFGSDKKGDISGYFQSNYKKYKDDIPWTEGAAESSSDGALIETTKKVTKSVIKSEEGARGSVRTNPMDGKTVAEFDGQVELYIINKDGVIFYPPVEEGMTLAQERYGSPSVLKFNVLKTPSLNFLEGSQVVLRVRGVNMFYGYVFTKSRSKDGFISCTAYDQLRYFKNKECYIYQNKTASELVKMIAEDFNLSVGTIEDTGYKIPQRVEDEVTLFDIVQTALSETMIHTGKIYFLYDDFGKLCVADSSKKLLDIVIDKETAEDFDYKTSIDDNVCTRVKFYYDNETTGERELYIANNTEKQNEWGVLQYSGKLQDGEDGAETARTYLEIYNEKTRKLTIKGANGIPEARAGFSVYVNLDLGDIVQRHFMLIEKSIHTFSHCEHSMDLTLRGGDFVA